MRMFNNCRFGLLTVAFVAALTMSTFGAVASADEPVAAANDSNKEAEEFFNKMSPEQFSDPVALDDFIRRFPESDKARIAFAYRYSLLEQMPTIEGYNEFIAKYPDKLQAQVAIQEVFKLYRYQNRVTGYYDFIKRYPNTQQAVVAMMRIQELMFEYVCKLDKEEEYDGFISAFPDAPQIINVLEKAKLKALEKEKTDFEKFQNGEPKPNDNAVLKYIFDRISVWEEKVDDFLSKYPSIDISANTSSEDKIKIRNQLFKIDREAFVLRRVFGGYDRAGRIQSTRNSLEIIKRLDKINQTLEANHKELLAKLDEETNKICDKLEQLHLDNQQIVQELRNGFAVLHKDMVEIKKQLSKINETLDQMDSHLEEINRSIVKGFEQTNENITKLNKTVQAGFEVQAQLQREQLAELRIQSSRLTDLSLIAERGYNQSGSLWESQYAAGQTSLMNRRFSTAGSGSSMIAKGIGALASGAATFIPGVGPYIAPAVGKITEHLVDNVAIPCVQDLYADITNPNDRRTLSEKCKASAVKAGTQAVQQLGEALPVVWQEEKGNILHAAQILANNSGIPEQYSKPIIDAAGSDDLNEAVVSLANHYNIPPEAMTFAAQYIY